MEFQFTEEQEEFRSEVRDFLEEEIKKGTFKPFPEGWIEGHDLDFSRKLAQKGWIGLTWPRRYGGQGKGYLDRLVLTEEFLRYGAPVAAHWFNDRQIGPCLLAYGSEELKEEFIPKMTRAEVFFGVGMSEPDAGSDLASLRTKAREDGDFFVIDGQKIWTSGAQHFTHLYIVARTDPTAPKHRGISEFIIDLNLSGVIVRPITDITGGQHFNEVFLESVRVHKKYFVGEKNRGWYQITPQLDYERSGIERLMSNYPVFEALIRYLQEKKEDGKPLSKNSLIRAKLSQLRVESEVGRLLVYRVAWLLDQEKVPNYETAMTKAYCTSFQKRMIDTAMEILGLYGPLLPESKWAPFGGMTAHSYLFSPGYSIQGGTTEILKNIVALRGLELPAK